MGEKKHFASKNVSSKDTDEIRLDPVQTDIESLNISEEKDSKYDSQPQTFAPMTGQYTSKKNLRRYSGAIKHLIPYRKKTKDKKVLEVDKAGFFSLITFSWMSKYIYEAYKKGLTIKDMPLGSPLDSCDLNAQRLEKLWQNELNAKGISKASFSRVIWKFVQRRVLICCLIFSLSCLMGFICPTIFMRKLLQYLEDGDGELMTGFVWALALTSAEILRTSCFALYYSLSYRTGIRLRSACLGLVYRKMIQMNSTRNISAAEIINLYSFDGPRLYYMIIFGPMTIGGPVIAICCLLTIYFILGPQALLGMIPFALYYPFQFLLARLAGYFGQKAVKATDKRIKLVTEILTNIKLIKMYAWDNWFFLQIQDMRKKELHEIEKISYCHSIGISLAPTIPVISAMLTFLIHVMSGESLTAAQAFSVLVFFTKQMKTSIQVLRDGSLAIYEGIVSAQRFKVYTILAIFHTQLRTALNNMRFGSDNIIQGRVVCNRFQNFFTLEENITNISRFLPDNHLALAVKDGFFSWNVSPLESDRLNVKSPTAESKALLPIVLNSASPEVLHSINLSVPKGSLIGVCGLVGSGKTSLLLACLGQLKMTKGQIYRNGTCAYVTQQSWIENTSLKNNILFGKHYVAEKYAKVLDACVLNEDINTMPDGDESEIGERGVNLSGGQKQRISLARALYADRDIYFLDDPLSAVDSSVGLQIFERCILKALKLKTVIMVTSQLQFLRKCDEIWVMKNGRIANKGIFDDLAKDENIFGYGLQTDSSVSSQKELKENKMFNINIQSNENPLRDSQVTKNVKFTREEEQLRGTIRLSAYRAYVAAAGGYIVAFLVILIILFNVGSNVFSSWWLAMWIKEGSGNTTIIDPVTNKTVISQSIINNPNLSFYMRIYASIIILIVATCVIRGFVYTKVTLRASKKLHNTLFQKILKSPVSYFERTPLGQIQNLLSRDIDEIDSRLPESVETMLQNIWAVLFSFLSITLVFYWFLVPLLVLACLYYFISKIFRVAIRDLKRIERISQSHVNSLISTTVQGLPVIHAFNKENDFNHRFCKVFDKNLTISYMYNNAMRWMAVRLDFISVIITFTTALLVVLFKDEVTAAFAGLALTYAAQICGVFQYTIRLLTENEARFISVERIQTNIEKLAPEESLKETMKVEHDWPSKGDIHFDQVKLSYGNDLPDVLNDISISVAGGEKIGVVGRTGAGKTSLIAALFRLFELSSGAIYVDGIDIAKISLHDLRSRLSVIPQEPTLFTESLRANLDPFNNYSEKDLWKVLEKIKLLEKVKSMSHQLATQVGEGESLSLGEKQLVCLARTLLRNSKILVLDEATASIDPETEMAIQTTIQEEFKNCTIIIIAHRLSTVKNCDRILVIDHGNVVEFDDPKALITNPDSQFYKMVEASEFL